jgi:site-specific DNA recombinase
MLTTVVSAMAELESDFIGERTRMGLQAVARSGRQPCGQPPLGYRVVGERKNAEWFVEDSEAEVVRRIFAEYIGGAGANTIARRLNEDEARTRRGAKFSARVIQDILDNPAYIGLVRFKGETWPLEPPVSIIDLATWGQVRQLRKARRTAPTGGRGRPPKGPHLFVNGLLRCGQCRSAMSPRTNPNGWQFYICTRHHTYRDCPTPAIAPALGR